MRLHSDYREQIGFTARVVHVGAATALGFLILAVQLVRLQILQGMELHRQSMNNSIRLLPLPAPRGLITDRAGRPLVDNRPAFAIDFIPGETRDVEGVLARLATFIDVDSAAILDHIRTRRAPRFALERLKYDLTLEDVLPVEEHRVSLPGVVVSVEPQRRDIYGPLFAHVVGTIGEISAGELATRAALGYSLGDWIGKSGIERTGETTLRGADGALQVQVYADTAPQPQMLMLTGAGRETVSRDPRGRQIRTLGRRAAQPGDTLVLSLDLPMQQAAEAALGEYRGAVVVLDSTTGAVRAMISHPSFDPNVFVRPARAGERAALLSDPAHPMLNRALRSYAPGSAIKLASAYAGLTNGVITPDTEAYCPGHYTLGRTYHCWRSGGHGHLNTLQAVAYSCDVFFYRLGHDLGIGPLARTFRDFGLGAPTGIELAGESAGLVPGHAWKQRQAHLKDRQWYEGEPLNVVIGQGQLLVTPLQLARMLTPFLNGGYLVRPYVVERAETPEGTLLYRTAAERTRVPGWDSAAAAAVVEGMRAAVVARTPFSGTARRARLKHLDVIGKTGTAQVVRLKDARKRRKTEEMPYKERDHAWFLGAVLDRAPRLAVAVFVEHGGHASETAVLVADRFFRAVYPEGPVEVAPDDAPGGTEA